VYLRFREFFLKLKRLSLIQFRVSEILPQPSLTYISTSLTESHLICLNVYKVSFNGLFFGTVKRGRVDHHRWHGLLYTSIFVTNLCFGGLNIDLIIPPVYVEQQNKERPTKYEQWSTLLHLTVWSMWMLEIQELKHLDLSNSPKGIILYYITANFLCTRTSDENMTLALFLEVWESHWECWMVTHRLAGTPISIRKKIFHRNSGS